MENFKLGILVADEDEYIKFEEKFKSIGAVFENSCFRRKQIFSSSGNEVVSVCFGIGKVNAATAATYLISNGCDMLLNYGYSGGISGVSRGDVMLCDSFLEHDFDLTPIGYKPCEKPRQEYIYTVKKPVLDLCRDIFGDIYCGRAATGDCFISDDTKRKYLKETFGASCCDMETAAIASVCYRFGVPFISFREISDDAGNDAKTSYRNAVKEQQLNVTDMVFEVIENIDKFREIK